jgi:plastocyanin
VLAANGFTGCGGNQNQQPTSSASVPTRRIDLATTGAISGTVTLEGSPPVSKPIDMSAEPYCDKLNPAPVFPQQVVTGKGGTLANVVVYIKDFPAEYIVDAPPAAATLSQRGCIYDPHVVALRVGETLEIKNEDQATHNILAMPTQNPRWNRSETPGAPPIEETFAVPELAIPLRCNVHPWMKSYVFVFSHPYFAVTGQSGQYELRNVPAGIYKVDAWQEKYGAQETTITVAPQKSNVTNFKFNASNATGN